MDRDEVIYRLSQIKQATDEDEKERRTEGLIDYISGMIANESDRLNVVFLLSITFVLQLTLDTKRADRKLEKKIDDLQSTYSSILERMQKLEHRVDDIYSGK